MGLPLSLPMSTQTSAWLHEPGASSKKEIVRIRVKGPASVSPWAEEPVASAGDKDILMTVDNRVASDWMDCSALALFEVVESGRVAVMVHGDEVREISTLVVCDVHIKQVADVRTDKGLA